MTLIEVLIASALFLFVLGIVVTCIGISTKLFDESVRQMSIHETADQFLTELGNQVRGANAVATEATGATLALRYPDGNEIAYQFDEEHQILTRYLKTHETTAHRNESRMFPPAIRVDSVSFGIQGCNLLISIVLSDSEEDIKSPRYRAYAFHEEVALRSGIR